MDAKKCDRCGTFYVPVKKPTDVKSNIEMVAAALNKNNTPKHITDVCDLCPTCVNAFYDWLREGGRNAQNS